MLDMSWGEVMVIGAVALIVIGPKDLPKALRTVGQVTGKLRRMAAEFQSQFNEAMREADLDDAKRQLQGLNDSVTSMNRGFNPIQTIRDELKSAVETPVAPQASAVAQEASAAAAPGAGEAVPPLALEPPIVLPDPPLPPVVDPAEDIAASLRQEAEAKAAAAAAVPAPLPEKPDAKA